jgi:hypothetical protein
MLDNKSKEFWAQKAKPFNIGKSITVLQITNEQAETLLVP